MFFVNTGKRLLKCSPCIKVALELSPAGQPEGVTSADLCVQFSTVMAVCCLPEAAALNCMEAGHSYQQAVADAGGHAKLSATGILNPFREGYFILFQCF